MNAILLQEDLFEIANVKQKTSLVAWLHEKNIKYDTGKKGRVFTTLDQLNKSLEGDNDEIGDFHG